MAIDGIEVHVVSRPFDERFNMEFVFVFNDTLDDGNRLLISRYRIQYIEKVIPVPAVTNVWSIPGFLIRKFKAWN
jgi:hypothetical protein